MHVAGSLILQEMKKAVKWYAKRLIRRYCPKIIGDRLLGRGGAQYHLWSIGIFVGTSPLQVRPSRSITNPVLTRQDVSDVRALFVADPFMIQVGGRWYMFFEVYNFDSDRGEIGLATSDDGFRWKYEQIVLREAFHLSYPYVFEWEQRFYMVPECHQTESVRLYEATQFPTEWVCTDVLLTGHRFNDNSLFYHKDYWWLFAETSPFLKHDTLRLYYAERLRGPWREHAMSPVVTGDPHTARPAGRILVSHHRVIRFAQDCYPTYGTRVRAFEITELTPRQYREYPVPHGLRLHPHWTSWTEGGMHHIDAQQVASGQWIAAVDGWRPVGGLVPEAWRLRQC